MRLEDHVTLPYRLQVIPSDDSVLVIRFPDLPGCVTQVERWDDVYPAAREILEGWLELAREDGQAIPPP